MFSDHSEDGGLPPRRREEAGPARAGGERARVPYQARDRERLWYIPDNPLSNSNDPLSNSNDPVNNHRHYRAVALCAEQCTCVLAGGGQVLGKLLSRDQGYGW